MRDEYKKLITVYNDHPALRSSGQVVTYDDDENNVLCVDRVLNNDNVLVFVNVRDIACSTEVPVMWSNQTVDNLMTGGQMQLGRRITLKPYQYLLLCKPK